MQESNDKATASDDPYKALTKTYLDELPTKKRASAETVLRIFAKTLNLSSPYEIRWQAVTYGDVVEGRNKILEQGKSAETSNEMIAAIVGVVRCAAKGGLVSEQVVESLESITKSASVRKGKGPKKPGGDHPERSYGFAILGK